MSASHARQQGSLVVSAGGWSIARRTSHRRASTDPRLPEPMKIFAAGVIVCLNRQELSGRLLLMP